MERLCGDQSASGHWLRSSQKRKAAVVLRINRLSTADKPVVNRGFVRPSVYIGFSLFVQPKRRSGQLPSMPWRARGTVVFCANRPVGVPSCPAPARPAAPPCAAPPRPAHGVSGFWTRQANSNPKNAGGRGSSCFEAEDTTMGGRWHHGTDGDLRPDLRSEDRRLEVFVLRNRKIEEPPPIFEELPSSKNPFHLRSSAPKNEEPAPIFDLRSRRTKNPPPSSIFDRRPRRSKNPPHLRSSASKIAPKIGRKTEREERAIGCSRVGSVWFVGSVGSIDSVGSVSSVGSFGSFVSVRSVGSVRPVGH